jgi:hypothetical protein
MSETAEVRRLLVKARELAQRQLDELDDALVLVDRLHDAEIEARYAGARP